VSVTVLDVSWCYRDTWDISGVLLVQLLLNLITCWPHTEVLRTWTLMFLCCSFQWSSRTSCHISNIRSYIWKTSDWKVFGGEWCGPY